MHKPDQYKPIPCGTAAGWMRIGNAPLFGGAMGTVFDNYVIYEDGRYKMWYSWRPVTCIVYSESPDGKTWSLPKVALTLDENSEWESSEVSRPTVLHLGNIYHMWYTGHTWCGNYSTSVICYATSPDGIHWKKYGEPVLKCTHPWEKKMIWCPHVIWEEDTQIFKMWYSGGATPKGEADAIGYAESKDGINWKKHPANPIFGPDPSNHWEMYKVSACFVWKQDEWYYMTYLGSDSDMRAANGMARSRDGITGWQRHPDNPTFGEVEGQWDCAGVCKVSILKCSNGYMGWYNGFNHTLEEMGLLWHEGFDFQFPEYGTTRESIRGNGTCYSEINEIF